MSSEIVQECYFLFHQFISTYRETEVTRTISFFPLLDNSYTLNPTFYGRFLGAGGGVVLLGSFGGVFFGEVCVLLLWGFF